MSPRPAATHEQNQLVNELTKLKAKAGQLGLFRTARMLDIATQEIGWELAGSPTPDWQKKRQKETLGV